MVVRIEIPEKTFTKYEKSRILGARATQIANGAPLLIKLTKKQLEAIQFDPLEIAKLEFNKGKIPLEIKRILPHERLGLEEEH